MPSIRMIIEMDLESGRLKVGHPDSKAHCDYMLAEAKRILDRLDLERHYREKGGVVPAGSVAVPVGLVGDAELNGSNGGTHG